MKANELTEGQIFTTADTVKIVARNREIAGESVGDLRFKGVEEGSSTIALFRAKTPITAMIVFLIDSDYE